MIDNKTLTFRIFGMFEMTTPVFVIRNPSIVEQVFKKDFSHFTNRRAIFRDGGLFEKGLLEMENEKWKNMRSNLSPAYTGSKLRGMFDLIQKIAQQAAQYLKDNELETDLDLKDFLSRFANDVIASTAFGFEMNSLEERENKFFKMGQAVSNFSNWVLLKVLILTRFNKIATFLGVSILSEEQHKYFMTLVLDSMKTRSQKKIFRPDMINMLMEVKGIGVHGVNEHKSNNNWSEEDIVAQCFIFFFAGFRTISSSLSFIIHELMENQDVQQKLKEEIKDVLESLDGSTLTYEALSKMNYMEAVISESLRKWPQIPLVHRVCTKAIDLEDPDTGRIIKLKPGDAIQVAAVGIQRDPKYYPNPLKFDPERFSEENKKSIQANTYLPFGIGPRMCIGNRFAMLEMKALLFYLLKDVTFVPSVKSCIPLELECKTPAQVDAKGGFWVKVVADKI